MRAETVKRVLRRMSPAKALLERVSEIECRLAAKWVSSAHRRLMAIQWVIPPTPEHFDHNIDQYYQFSATRNPLWVERGVFGSLALKGGAVLELACGDGYNAKNFYSISSEMVTACDFDPAALKTAERKNRAPNVEYVLADIRTKMPTGMFDNVVWDAAIEHFTEDEIYGILGDIKSRLSATGVLSGYTIVEQQDGSKSLDEHEYEFKGKADLMRVLAPHFRNVTVFETKYPSRHNLYFWASDAGVPFDQDWPAAIRAHGGQGSETPA